MTEVVDLLDRPVYMRTQVDRILGLPSGTAWRWIDGYTRAGRRYPPVVRPEPTGDEIVTWGEFVEARLLAEYRDAGVPMVNMRPAVNVLREESGHRYPLAWSAPFLDRVGRELVKRIQDEVGLEGPLQLVVVRNKQLVLADPAEDFVQSADFEDDRVVRFHPDDKAPEIVIDPLRGFGEPVVRAVPTEIIAEQANAGDDPELIAEVYELPVEHVQAAIRFERARSA